MPVHTENIITPYSPEQLFDLVADVARYPEFLPWCSAARVESRRQMPDGSERLQAELVVSFKHISERYVSEVRLHPHHAINVTQIRGPFSQLHNSWRFTPTEDGGTHIHFMLEFRFRSAMLEKIIGLLFHRATQKMVSAFTERAHMLYGQHTHNSNQLSPQMDL